MGDIRVQCTLGWQHSVSGQRPGGNGTSRSTARAALSPSAVAVVQPRQNLVHVVLARLGGGGGKERTGEYEQAGGEHSLGEERKLVQLVLAQGK